MGNMIDETYMELDAELEDQVFSDLEYIAPDKAHLRQIRQAYEEAEREDMGNECNGIETGDRGIAVTYKERWDDRSSYMDE